MRLDEDEKGLTTIQGSGGRQELNVVSESGLYHLIFTPRKPQAKAFCRWVTETVLPSIRSTGGYQTTKAGARHELLREHDSHQARLWQAFDAFAGADAQQEPA